MNKPEPSPMTVPVVTVPTLAIAGRPELFPVRRIYCVGQNYADHAREMGSDPERDPPFFFSKPADTAVPSGSVLPFPPRTENLHHEVELVLALGGGGSDVSVEAATGLIFGCAIGVDLTRRDLQAEAKRNGRPWDMAKGFDRSAPIGAITPGLPPAAAAIGLSVNGEVRQTGQLSDMIWSPAEIVSILSTFVTLEPGDLIFTGTPAGVGPLRSGDGVLASIEGLVDLSFRMA